MSLTLQYLVVTITISHTYLRKPAAESIKSLRLKLLRFTDQVVTGNLSATFCSKYRKTMFKKILFVLFHLRLK